MMTAEIPDAPDDWQERIDRLAEQLVTVEAERDQLRYERSLLGTARSVLDAAAEYEYLDAPARRRVQRQSVVLAQRIVDEIGHPVTDEPALGQPLREQVAALVAERDEALRLVRSVVLCGTGYGWTGPDGVERILDPAEVTVYLAVDVMTERQRLRVELDAAVALRDLAAQERDEARSQRNIVAAELEVCEARLVEMTAHRDAAQVEYDEMRAGRDGFRDALAKVGAERDTAREVAKSNKRHVGYMAEEVESMRPVVEAASAYADLLRLTNALGVKNSRPAIDLLGAVDAYRSQDAELLSAFGNARVRFWVCPVRGHSDRIDPGGRPVVTVEWVDDVARCTAPGCGRTSAAAPAQEAQDGPGEVGGASGHLGHRGGRCTETFGTLRCEHRAGHADSHRMPPGGAAGREL